MLGYIPPLTVWAPHKDTLPHHALYPGCKPHVKIPGDYEFYLQFFGKLFLLMMAPHNAMSFLKPDVFVWAPARKHTWCFHSHGKPVLLTFTSAFMWPNSKANLRAHNMFVNQLLRTDAGAITELWRHIRSKTQQSRLSVGMLGSLHHLWPVILVPVLSIHFDCSKMRIAFCRRFHWNGIFMCSFIF